MRHLLITIVSILILTTTAFAEDRGSAADSMTKLGATADSLSRAATSSADRAVRKKMAPKATDLADDLNALAKRTRKDVPLKTIAKELADLGKDAGALIDLADEAEDKTERRSLRAQATQLEQGIAAVRKTVDTIAASDDKKAAPAKPAAMKPAAFAALVQAVGDANTDTDKVAVARAAGANYFTANQIATLMDLINTEMPKVDLAAALWSHLVDPENGFVIFSKLELQGSKAELHRRVG